MTVFLLILISLLGSANVLLGSNEKSMRNTNFLKTPKTSNLQYNKSNKISALKNTSLFSLKEENFSSSDRIKILEEYLKKI